MVLNQITIKSFAILANESTDFILCQRCVRDLEMIDIFVVALLFLSTMFEKFSHEMIDIFFVELLFLSTMFEKFSNA